QAIPEPALDGPELGMVPLGRHGEEEGLLGGPIAELDLVPLEVGAAPGPLRFAGILHLAMKPFLDFPLRISREPLLVDAFARGDEAVLVADTAEQKRNLELARLGYQGGIEQEWRDRELLLVLRRIGGMEHERSQEGERLDEVALSRGVGPIDG